MTRAEAIDVLGQFDEHLARRLAERRGSPDQQTVAEHVQLAVRFAIEEMQRMEGLEK